CPTAPRSNRTTSWPAACSVSATASPAGPAPTIAISVSMRSIMTDQGWEQVRCHVHPENAAPPPSPRRRRLLRHHLAHLRRRARPASRLRHRDPPPRAHLHLHHVGRVVVRLTPNQVGADPV